MELLRVWEGEGAAMLLRGRPKAGSSDDMEPRADTEEEEGYTAGPAALPNDSPCCTLGLRVTLEGPADTLLAPAAGGPAKTSPSSMLTAPRVRAWSPPLDCSVTGPGMVTFAGRLTSRMWLCARMEVWAMLRGWKCEGSARGMGAAELSSLWPALTSRMADSEAPGTSAGCSSRSWCPVAPGAAAAAAGPGAMPPWRAALLAGPAGLAVLLQLGSPHTSCLLGWCRSGLPLPGGAGASRSDVPGPLPRLPCSALAVDDLLNAA
mmetsp:Transcript_15346/g.33249  ORF Transcript_15346/g.33249 Transcript_15346/m.33249 type:complete len:263 (+) Transcript_15346:1103-1891(+)